MDVKENVLLGERIALLKMLWKDGFFLNRDGDDACAGLLRAKLQDVVMSRFVCPDVRVTFADYLEVNSEKSRWHKPTTKEGLFNDFSMHSFVRYFRPSQVDSCQLCMYDGDMVERFNLSGSFLWDVSDLSIAYRLLALVCADKGIDGAMEYFLSCLDCQEENGLLDEIMDLSDDYGILDLDEFFMADSKVSDGELKEWVANAAYLFCLLILGITPKEMPRKVCDLVGRTMERLMEDFIAHFFSSYRRGDLSLFGDGLFRNAVLALADTCFSSKACWDYDPVNLVFYLSPSIGLWEREYKYKWLIEDHEFATIFDALIGIIKKGPLVDCDNLYRIDGDGILTMDITDEYYYHSDYLKDGRYFVFAYGKEYCIPSSDSCHLRFYLAISLVESIVSLLA